MTPPSQNAPAVAVHIRSVDTLCGFDMFWILGAGMLVKAIGKMSDNGLTHFLTNQLTHVQWIGLVFYDLIFPLFLLLSGVSIVCSLDAR